MWCDTTSPSRCSAARQRPYGALLSGIDSARAANISGCAKPPNTLAISPTTTDLLEHNARRFLSDADVLSRCALAPQIHRPDPVDAQSACEDQLSGAFRLDGTGDTATSNCRFASRVSCRPDRQSS